MADMTTAETDLRAALTRISGYAAEALTHAPDEVTELIRVHEEHRAFLGSLVARLSPLLSQGAMSQEGG